MDRVFTILTITVFSGLATPITTFAATWDQGAQGIKVSSTTTSFNVATLQDDFFGVDYGGTGASRGQSTQNNAYLSGQTVGTNYMWSQAIAESYAPAGTTYTSYTCTTQSGTYTCKTPSQIKVKGSHQLQTDEGSFPFYCPSSWFRVNGSHCYLINENAELTKSIGSAGKKRFDLNAYHTLQSDGKVDTFMKMRTCTSHLSSSCGTYVDIFNPAPSQTLTSSNQYFFCDTVESLIHCPSSASVGWEGDQIFRPLTGTYVEHSYTIDSSATETYKVGNLSPSETNDDVCWWTTITDPGGSNPTYKSTYKYNTASQCHS